jgi:hypothetical protein
LLALRWWDWPHEAEQANLPQLMRGEIDRLRPLQGNNKKRFHPDPGWKVLS